jgi:hypothetical protein
MSVSEEYIDWFKSFLFKSSNLPAALAASLAVCISLYKSKVFIYYEYIALEIKILMLMEKINVFILNAVY